ncbi:MAG: HAMP domain-containing histidine kinase [Clostridiales bacterium]|nr:HAMP domain-containing histidine kinase [Clostridiales bacterium]
MRKFLRSFAGKFICFLVCVLSAVLMAGSVLGVILMAEEDFYTSSLTTLQRDVIAAEANSAGYRFNGQSYGVLLETPDEVVERESDDECFAIEIYDEDDNLIVVSSNIDRVEGQEPITTILQSIGEGNDGEPAPFYTTKIYYDPSVPMSEQLALYYSTVNYLYSIRYTLGVVAAASLLLAIISFVILMAVSGRRPDTEQIVPGVLNKVPFDVLAAVSAGVAALLMLLLYYAVVETNESYAPALIFGSILGACVVSILLGLCMSISARLKQHNLIRNTLIFKVLSFLWRCVRGLHRFNMNIIRGLPLIIKTLVILAVVGISDLVVIGFGDFGYRLFFDFARYVVIVPLILYFAVTLRKLQKSGEALATGDLEYHTKTSTWKFLPDLRVHGENLNSIAKGMNLAVNEKLKSERMKTELITNVSHDIKTPLTSIINYADLISKEESDNPKIKEYSEVLVRQSERLKRLTEDLVEASKASTGNLEVNLEPCEAAVFVTQASGEYKDKLFAADLELITKLPEEDLRIMADGRRMWRVFDNLMNNICKYAQPGTRVYLTLEKEGDRALFTFKNTSARELDISEEELMERFVRGDKSRNSETEGNGLGLSIARSMAELQKGTLNIKIDGDLFKAVLSFPLI